MTRTVDEIDGTIFDSREIIERMEEIEAMLPEDAHEVMPGDAEEIEDLRAELASLRELTAEAEGCYISDWQYGETFIPEHRFVEYAEELAEDIGAIDRNASWPLSFIDWDAAADALRQDYTAIEWRGTTYYAR